MSSYAQASWWLLLCLLGTRLAGGEAPATPDWVMPDDERKELTAVVDRAIAGGMPGARGGQLFVGTLSITHGAPKPSAAPAEEDDAAPPAQTEPSEIDGEHYGLHCKLADGSWLLNMVWPVTPSAQLHIEEKDLKPVPIDKVTATLKEKGRGQSNYEWNDPNYLGKFVEAQRPMIQASMKTYSIMPFLVNSQPVTTQVSIVHLLRLGVPEADRMALFPALAVLWDDTEAAWWSATAAPLRLVHSQMGAPMAIGAMQRFQIGSGYKIEHQATSLRHALVEHFYSELCGTQFNPVVPIAPAKAAKVILALLDEQEPGSARIRAQVAALLKRIELPIAAPPSADMATRLASWDTVQIPAGYNQQNMEAYLEVPDADLEHYPSDLRSAILEMRKKPDFSASDLDSLVALIGDRRPSRWLDGLVPRTIGENAMRAIASILSMDPRPMIKRDAAAPWSDAERDATDQALTAWWQLNKDKSLVSIIAANAEQISLGDFRRMLDKATEKDRANILNLIAKVWAGRNPDSEDSMEMARIMVLGKGNAPLEHAVAAWPISGKNEMLLCVWHLMHADVKPFEDRLAKELDITPRVSTTAPKPGASGQDTSKPGPEFPGLVADEADSEQLSLMLNLASAFPTTKHLLSVISRLTPPLDANGQRIAFAFSRSLWSSDQAISILLGKEPRQAAMTEEKSRAQKAEHALSLSVFALLLKDSTPVDAKMISQYGLDQQAARMVRHRTAAESPKPPALASDLRMCDVAAITFVQMFWQMNLQAFQADGAQPEGAQRISNLSLDLTASKELRDPVILELRNFIAPLLTDSLNAAGLPAYLPGVSEPPVISDSKDAF